MAAAMEERSSSSAGLQATLGAAQAAAVAACHPALQHLQACAAALAGEEREPQAEALAAAVQAAAAELRGLPPAESDVAGCVRALGSAVGQLAAGCSHVAGMVQERRKVRGKCAREGR